MRTNQFKILTVLLVCLASPLLSENDPGLSATKSAPAKTFVEKVEGGGRVNDAIQTTDGDYVSISCTGDATCIVRKVTVSGKRIWERSLSLQIADDGFARLNGIAQTNDGYVLVGNGNLSGYYGPSTGIVIALHSDGTIKWNKSFTPSGGSLSFSSVTSTPDGGFIVTGGVYPPDFHPIVVKFTSNGDIQWEKAFENLSFTFLSQPVSDNGLVLVSEIFGETGQSVGENVVKVDDSGNIVWKRTLKIQDFALQSLGITADNGVVLAGKSIDSSTLSLIGLNAKGKFRWTAKYSLNVPGFSISDLIQTADGGYAVTGATHKKSGAVGGFLLKIDSKQNLIFQRTFGFRGGQEEARSVFATNEGGYFLLGSSGADDMLVLSLNSDGLVPGCSFFHNLKSKTVASDSVSSVRLSINSDPVSLPTAGTIQLKSAHSKKSSSNICE